MQIADNDFIMAPWEERIAQLEESQRQMQAAQAALAAQLSAAERERNEYKKLYGMYREECERLRHGLVGKKAERTPEGVQQLSLAMLGLVLNKEQSEAAPVAQAQTQTIAEHERAKPTGRKALPDSLEVVRIEVLPNEVQERGLENFERIGEEVAEVVERRPASVVRVQVVRPKFVEKARERDTATVVHVAPAVELPIERGLAGPGLLADTLVRRFADHQPLHRMESIFARDGLPLARSTICNWHQALDGLVQPLIEAMFADAKQSPFVCVDATGVLVQAKEKCRHGHFWVLVAPGKHVLFRFTPKHNSKAVTDLLAGYKGYLVADAHSVYEQLYRSGDVIESGCWAHARRYFFKAIDTDLERSSAALTLMGRLFAVERNIADFARGQRESVRRDQSAPVVDAFFDWCRREQDFVLDDSPIEKGISYALNQEAALRRFLDDGRLPIHNNVSERELRREAVGRKNWLFVGSEDGARTNATFVSLIASAQMHGIEPWRYLRDLFCLLPSWQAKDVLKLAPAYWQETLQSEAVQQRLAANPFRQISERR